MKKPCPPGSISTEEGAACRPCPAGTSCDPGSGSYCPHKATPWPLPCPPGYDTDCPGQKECKSCNGTSHCKGAMLNPWEGGGRVRSSEFGAVSCRPGTYRNSEESPDCLLCPLGYYCPWGTAVRCPAGTYGAKEGLQRERDCSVCPAGAADPGWPCARGKFCPAGTMKEMNCPGGTYTRQQGAASLNECLKCPAGFYCPEGTSDPLPCPRGTFNPLQGQDDAMDCRLCYAGKACSQMALPQPDVDCMEGFTCPPGSSRPNALENACPPGTFSNLNNLTDRSQCGLCPPRHACVRGTGGIQRPPVSCFAGHYCPRGTMFPTQHKCAAGTWSDQTNLVSASECSPCPRGWYCLTGAGLPSGRCSSGHYCPEGYYCPWGTAVRCPAGTYGAKEGLQRERDCSVCPAGAADPGWPCARGKFCPAGTMKEMNCPGGTYTRQQGAASLNECLKCPAGFYCPEETSDPLPCPRGTFNPLQGQDDAMDCRLCYAGKACSQMALPQPDVDCMEGYHCSGSNISAPAGLCSPGYYCTGGASAPNQHETQEGHYTLLGAFTPEPCALGTFQPSSCLECLRGQFCNQTGLVRPFPCPPGHFCLPGTIAPTPCPAVNMPFGDLCPAGFFCLSGTRHPFENPCPPGTWSNGRGAWDQTSCWLCPPGHYCHGTGLTQPSALCAPGFYCSGGAKTSMPVDGVSGDRCPKGHYCPEGSVLPLSCPDGSYANITGVAECLDCPAGYYCLSGQSVQLCPEGHYCPGGTGLDLLPCPPGTYSLEPGNSQLEQCQLCPAGSEGAGGPCPVSHYCPGGSAQPLPCPAGTYNNLTGQAKCFQCGAGYYCPEKTSTYSDFPCPPGFYCPDGTRYATQFPCPRGYYNPEPMTQSLDSCLPCPPGHYCEKERLTAVSGTCKAGWFCVSAAWNSQPFDLDNYTNANCLCPATATGGKCQEGYYCPAGSSEPIPCPPGAYCNGSGLSRPSGSCSAGYYCSGGASQPNPTDKLTGNRCPPGSFCGFGSGDPQPCLPGTFSRVQGLVSESECLPCTEGFYCETAGLVTPSGPCRQGYFCPPGQRVSTGFACPVGHYCPEGSPAPVICESGSYQNLDKQAACKPCEEGYYCDNSLGPVQDPSQYPCPQGHYCPQGTRFATQYGCPVGTFNPRMRVQDVSGCLPCPPGKYCSAIGLAEPTGDCLAGFWCKQGAQTRVPSDGLSGGTCSPGHDCPSGHFCPKTSAAPQPCPGGTYCAVEGQASCSPCVEGYYCPVNSSSYAGTECAPGHYCPTGTSSLNQFPCPAGTYNPFSRGASVQDCISCDPGLHCASPGLPRASGQCAAGHYCVGGALTPHPSNGITGDLCPRGHYCSEGSAVPQPCPPGHYSNTTKNTALSDCLPCPQGFSCDGQGLSAPSGSCQAGYFCPPGQYSSRPASYTCTAGHMCPQGSSQQSPCPPGTYQDQHGQTETGLLVGTQNPTPCPKGHYCPPGTTLGRESPCPTGTFNNRTGLSDVSECVSCPAGEYCSSAGLSQPTGACMTGFLCFLGAFSPHPLGDSTGRICTPGFYCPQGTTRMLPCPAGTFSTLEGAGSEADCRLCPPGLYCQGPGLTAPSGSCSAGFYCTGGAKSPAPTDNTTGYSCGADTESSAGAGYYHINRSTTVLNPREGFTGNICPAGHFCPAGSSLPSPCPPGTFLARPGAQLQTECQSCVPGSYCSRWGQSSPERLCPEGWFCPEGSVTGEQSGLFCLQGCSSPSPCPLGSVSDAAGLQSELGCSPCPPGFHCNRTGLTAPTGPTCCSISVPTRTCLPLGECIAYALPIRLLSTCTQTVLLQTLPPSVSDAAGLQSELGCSPCPPGFHCNRTGLTAPTGPCTAGLCLAGYYCTGGAVTPTPLGDSTENTCLIDVFCKIRTPAYIFCVNGSCCNGTKAQTCFGWCSAHCSLQPFLVDQRQLTAGRASLVITVGSMDWPLLVARVLLATTVRAARIHPGQCITPAPRDTSALRAALSPRAALSAHCFFQGSSNQTRCPSGTYQAGWAQSACEECPAGLYCQGPGVIYPAACPVGSYCPPGSTSANQYLCPPGSYGNRPGLAKASDCSPCDPGMYCMGSGSTRPSGQCSPGFYCTGGSAFPAPGDSVMGDRCRAGFYCPRGSATEQACPAGTFSNRPGLSDSAQCQACSPGHFCTESGQPTVSGPCLAGFYCLEGSRSSTPFLKEFGGVCSPGHFCPNGTALPVPCPTGTYRAESGGRSKGDCRPCPAGNVHLSAVLSYRVSVRIHAHYYLPFSGSYQGLEGQRQCDPCPPGFYCRPQALHAQGAVIPQPCPAGHFCPRETEFGTQKPCPRGTHSRQLGLTSAAECSPCPAGYFCGSEGLVQPTGPCAPGFYCTAGAWVPNPSDSITGAACPRGKYCQAGSVVGGKPIPGHHCPPGSAHAHPCPTGEYQPNPGSDYCIPCRPGFYCEEAIAGDPRPCPPHTYCPAATQVPQLCPNGTFTLADMSGLQEERECLPCPSGKFCRGGKIQGSCAAGFLCLSGSSEFTPGGSELENRTSWFYCPEGTEEPSACPAHTVRASPGASQRDHCLPCPPQYWCKEGDPVLYLCPAGHYCNGLKESDPQITAGPQECPVHTYRADPGAGSRGDCLTCPAGYHCNSTGLTDYVHHPCPPGFWCPGSGSPVLCPAGTMRTEPGSTAVSHCDPCTAGFYCPDPMVTGQPNIHGIPCRASSECPPGAVTEVLCRAGSYCGPQTGAPSACPGGCVFPFYCPPSSSRLLPCDGGFMPVNVSGLRDSLERSCVECRSGTYRPSLESELHCLPCPAGYHCPQGTEHYMSNSCPIGYYCPAGTALAVPCPPGSYGNSTQAKHRGECYPCPADTFNHLFGQKACFPCGSSSFSLPGAASCICRGLNRAFQQSDGSCICRAGYVYYNELDQKRSTGNSDMDCQSEVNERCGPGEVRLASTRECVLPGGYDCTAACGSQGGNLSVELGICHCAEYVSAEELCNASCLSKMPKITASLGPNGQLVLNIKDREARGTRDKHVVDTLGPEQYSPAGGSVHIVQFAPEGVFGLIVKERRLLDVFLSGESTSPEVTETPNTLSRNRRSSEHAAAAARIPNPIACLKPNDMIIFQLSLNHRNRSLSHFPVYQKDHLFNSNPGWDSGAFRRLGHLVKETRFNFSRFAHVFSEPGKYVLLDNAAQERSLVVVVSEHHTECESRSFQPSSPGHLVRHGVLKQRQLNLVPNWGAIAGVLGLLALAVAVLTASALVLKPIHAGLSPWRSWKPKWRSLGEPCIPPGYIFTRDSCLHINKLEDQNLHLAAQLAKHRSEMLDFYKSICQQTEALKDRIRNGSASHTTVRYTFDKPFLVSPVILECVGLAGQQLQVPDASSQSLSEQELAGLITATPLSSTLQQILESLRDRHAQEQGRETWDQ
ncbi:UNVERIFIED_CONTAM: hypothetical protein FKN15_067495 [Acipenser sinensis]